ncbi:probable G-protein coupled receptor 139 [Chiloscyllium punctatum]|uniref:probable G-protein coupled receptor 139 n=1 Tax=Chiloscyllium punctatum TaxID=137246 RepID=UPI003B64042A
MEIFHSSLGRNGECLISDFRFIFYILSLSVNFLLMLVLSRGKCGLSNCTTRCLLAMAASDLLFIFAEIMLWRLKELYYPGCFLDITPVCSAVYVLLRASTDCSVWFTVLFTFDRFVTICCLKMNKKYWTDKTLAVALAATSILLCSKNIPFYFRYQPGTIINNVPRYCYIKSSYFTDPRWRGFKWFDIILTPFIPFMLILLMNTLTVRYILVASRVRKSLMGQSKGESRKDTEMESLKNSVICLFTISISFILLWGVHSANILYFSIKATDRWRKIHFTWAGEILRDLSCSTNTLFYAVTVPKFRAKFRNAVQQLVT